MSAQTGERGGPGPFTSVICSRVASLPGLNLATVAARATLEKAWFRVRTKAARGGIDGQTVDDFAARDGANLDRLRRELLKQRYVPAPTQAVRIPKEGSPSERRTLGLPSVRDKIVQEAVRSVLEPHAERRFLDCSYGYRPGRGPVRAIARVTHHVVHLRHPWIAVADIDDFFDSLDHARVLEAVRALGADEGILHLVALWLQMGAVDNRGRWRDVTEGVTQGTVVSPILANLYLNPFDRTMVGRGHALVRYADDFVVTAPDRAAAEAAFKDACAALDDLGLRLNDHPSPVAAVADGFPFLGIVFTNRARSLDPDKLEAARGKLGRIADGGDRDVDGTVRRLNETVAGLRGYYGVVLEADELSPLDDLLRETLLRLVREGLASGVLRSGSAARRALADMETVAVRTEDERRRWIERIVAEAKPATRRGASGPASAKRRSDRVPQPPAAAGAAARVVRRRKHRHHREQAHRRELVVDTPATFLGKAGHRLTIRRERRRVADLPLLQIAAVTVASHGVSLSSDVITLCAAHGVPLHFVSGDGRPLATLAAPFEASGRTALLQIRAVDGQTDAIALAQRFVEGKIRNQVSLLKRLRKSRREVAALTRCIDSAAALRSELDLDRLGPELQTAQGRLFSIEGRAAQHYWAAIQAVVPAAVGFTGRRRRGAADLVNSLLNYGYGVLQRDVHLAILKAGLNPAISFLHSFQARKPTLVFDLMEEFRAPVVDRPVVTLLNRREPVALNGAGQLTVPTRRLLLRRLQERLTALVPNRDGEATLEQVIARQAGAIVRHLAEKRPYRPFLDRW